MLDAAQKPQIIFQLIVGPVILGCEADQQSGRFPLRVMTTNSRHLFPHSRGGVDYPEGTGAPANPDLTNSRADRRHGLQSSGSSPQSVTDARPVQPEGAREFVRRMRGEDRY
jgi:hypothetical protein